jgi:cytochrome c1
MRKKGYFVLVALVLAACGSPAAPQTLPTTSPSPSATRSEVPGESPSPPGPSKSDASAALARYFRVANETAKGASLGRFTALFAPSCVACESARRDFESARQSGLVADNDRYVSWSIRTLKQQRGQVLLQSTNQFAEVALVDAAGTEVTRVDAWNGAQFAWTLRRQGDDWLIIQGDLL